MIDLVHPHELPTVLLIDDDMVSREVMATMLIMSGYPVHTAPDGAAALELLGGEECVPGVILMDAQMPGLSGTILIEQLRARSKATIVAISASNPPKEVTKTADAFLLKPFAPNVLTALLEERQAKTSPQSNNAGLDPEETIINPETLSQLREMMPEAGVRQIYEAIVADLGRRLAAIDSAIAANDAAEVRRIGHAIKGGCGMAGAHQASRLGALLEEGALEVRGKERKVNQLDNNAQVLRDLRNAAGNLERMLEVEFPR